MRTILLLFLACISSIAYAQQNNNQNINWNGVNRYRGLHIVQDTTLLFVRGGDTCALRYTGGVLTAPCLSSGGVDSIWRVVGVDSIFWRLPSVGTFALKDSTGGDGLWEAGSGLGAIKMPVDTSIAPENVASGLYSFVTSVFNEASGDFSSAVGGVQNIASGEISAVVGGQENTSSGLASFAGGGALNIASGSASFAGGGGQNIASGAGSSVFGTRNTSRSAIEMALGFLNIDYTPADSVEIDTTDRVLSIGIGQKTPETPEIPRNALTILKSGRHGINTHLPLSDLHISDSTYTGGLYGFHNEKTSLLSDSVYLGYAGGGGKLLTTTATDAITVAYTIHSDTATLDFPTINSSQIATLTISVAGAEVGSSCMVGEPNLSDIDEITFSCRVSATDTVTVKAHNNSGGSVDLAPGVFSVTVIRKQ